MPCAKVSHMFIQGRELLFHSCIYSVRSTFLQVLRSNASPEWWRNPLPALLLPLREHFYLNPLAPIKYSGSLTRDKNR